MSVSRTQEVHLLTPVTTIGPTDEIPLVTSPYGEGAGRKITGANLQAQVVTWSPGGGGTSLTPSQRGLAGEVVISIRSSGNGTQTEDDPKNAGTDLAGIWAAVLAMTPKKITLKNASGSTIFPTTNFLELLDGMELDLGGATIQAHSSFWGSQTGILAGEQGLLGESNLTPSGRDSHTNVWIHNGTIDCNNNAQVAANARVNAVWLRGAKNRLSDLHIIGFGNKDVSNQQEQFVVVIGNDGVVERCHFHDQGDTTAGTISVISFASGHGMVGPLTYRVKCHDNTFDNLFSQEGGECNLINIQAANYCDVYDNYVNGLNRGSCVYDDTGSTFKTSIRNNKFLNVHRTGGSSGYGFGISIIQGGSYINTGLDIIGNEMELGSNGAGINVDHSTSNPDGSFDVRVMRNTVRAAVGVSDAPFGILLNNITGLHLAENYVGSGLVAIPFKAVHCDKIMSLVNHSTSIDYGTSTNITKILNTDLNYAPYDSSEIPVTGSNTVTLTNKRITPRVNNALAIATILHPSADNDDILSQANTNAADTTLTVSNPTGTPVDGQLLIIRIKSTNQQNFSWDTKYKGGASTPLPAKTTGASETDYLEFRYNTSDITPAWELTSRALGEQGS